MNRDGSPSIINLAENKREIDVSRILEKQDVGRAKESKIPA